MKNIEDFLEKVGYKIYNVFGSKIRRKDNLGKRGVMIWVTSCEIEEGQVLAMTFGNIMAINSYISPGDENTME